MQSDKQLDDPSMDSIGHLLAQADTARESQDVQLAVARYMEVLQVDPDNLYALFWLADLHLQAENTTAAASFCHRGLEIDPNQIGLLLTLGATAHKVADPAYALHVYERIRQLDPDTEGLDALLADQYCFVGQVAAGLKAFERALVRDPDSVALQSNRLFVSNYAGTITSNALYEEHVTWGRRHEAAIKMDIRPSTVDRDPQKRLRIGYVSPDLRRHAVAFFVEPLLQAHDAASSDLVVFDTSPYPEDEFTGRMKLRAQQWHRACAMTDESLASMIRACQIDVLVDLSGHTTLHRLLTFARKPAPVQATWLGYLNTTGLEAMDYRITDDYLDPPGTTERFHTEALFRLPNASCFQPPLDAPAIGPLPASRSGAFSFGSINHWAKVTDEVRSVWAAILAANPSARLVIVARGSQNAAFRHAIITEFVARGARAEQITVEPTRPLDRFLELLNELDATLDPFPYGGGTTTMHSLWMGVPVITLAGTTAFSRNSVGPLTETGLAHLVAASPEEYVEIASRLARNQEMLTDIRHSLRSRMQASPLLDATRFASCMDRAHRAMWRNFCSGSKIELRVDRA